MASPIDRFRNLTPVQKALAGGGAVAVVLAVVLVLALAGGDGDEEAGPTTTEAPTTTTAPPTAPLTGLPVEDDDVLSRPSIAAKLGNNAEARPQAGLDEADVVYEEEVEGRVTRFLAVFHSQTPERFGPIRSVRLMDPNIVAPLGGMFVFSGGEQVGTRTQRLRELGVRFLREEELGEAGGRILDRDHGNGVRPNILFGDPEALWDADQYEDLEPPQPLFSYLAEGESFNGEPVDEVTVPVGSGAFHPTWRWDPADSVWKRFYGDQPFMAKSGQQVAMRNLVVQFVEVQGEESVVVGEGEAVVFAEGEMIRGRWVRDDVTRPARLLDETGAEIKLVPGQTWVHLPRAGGSLATAGPTTTTAGQ